jgi:CRP-like cAMP-binding protein
MKSLDDFIPVSSLTITPTASSEESTLGSTLNNLPTSFSHSPAPTFSVAHYVNDTHQLSTSQQRARVVDILHKDLSHRSNDDIHFIAKFLLTIDIFSHFNSEIRIELARVAKIKRFNREEVIFREDDDVLVIYIILSGSVGTRMDSLQSASPDLSGSSYIAGIQNAGSSLDVVVSSLFSSDVPRRTSTRMAIERTELMVIDVTQYKLILKSVENENEKEKINFLLNLPLFDLCSPAEIKSVAHVMKKMTIRKNSLLFSQDEKSDAVYFITHGSCRVIRRVILSSPDEKQPDSSALYEVATLVPPAFVGELGVINSSKRTCSVYAENLVTVYQITREDFLSCIPSFLLAYFDEYAKAFYINDGDGKNTWEKKCVGYHQFGRSKEKALVH